MATCFGTDGVFVLNEIAAHAAGALHFDLCVDTIFEIGGQDAKYIRLSDGRVVDCAMNEACSAGTGSFIEEQGSRFPQFTDVPGLGHAAMAAPGGVSLGQHCSVFMAEVIEEAFSAGIRQDVIVAGLYDSIIQNYLNRVKGNRSVGRVIFCQGMPFQADALAAAVARQTGSRVVVPPNPGTIGALGIALLAEQALPLPELPALDLPRFLAARIEKRDTFICKSTTGCGGSGNCCRIDFIHTLVEREHKRFNWGGGCSLYDRGASRKKLPDLAPDPMREREKLVHELVGPCTRPRGKPIVALADEFMLKGLFPFFAAYLVELGLDLLVVGGADQDTLRRGIQEANIPFCAPMQLFQGLASKMADTDADFLFLPMIRSSQRNSGERHSAMCPIVQASPDLLRWNLGPGVEGRVISPVVDLGAESYQSREFIESCRALAIQLDINDDRWRQAHRAACEVQERFDAGCLAIGRRALEYCAGAGVTPIVILGRPYTIYNIVLNSNVPALLREQGAIGVPVDCYPVADEVPVFDRMYWGYGQRLLRAAHQIRRAPGVYSLYCSNYSCGPDSFNLHFYGYIMEGKPFAVIETDGHAGDAGTKTRIEAFLYCVHQDGRGDETRKTPKDFQAVEAGYVTLPEMREQPDRVLIPWAGLTSEAIAACLTGSGIPAESLPKPGPEALRLGRRVTSGKECLPMCVTLGSLLEYLQSNYRNGDRYTL
ncbi:MAG: acyl-CoA dehydratase activase-related protein, partial [Acidobacteriota bacterium]